MGERNLTVKDRAGRDVPAKTLVDRHGRDVINPNTGEPFVVPRDYDPQKGVDLGRRIGSQLEEAYDDFSLSQLQAKIYFDLVQAFKQGGPEDLQRSYNGKVGGGGPEFVDAFRDAASYHFGLTAAAAGLFSGTIYAGGGFYNLHNYLKDIVNKLSSNIQLGFMFNNPRNTKSIEKGISDLEKGVHKDEGRNTQDLDRSLKDSDPSESFGGREISAAGAAKGALKAGSSALKAGALAENAKNQDSRDQSTDPGSNLPGAKNGGSSGGSSNGSGGQGGQGYGPGDGSGHSGNPSHGGSPPSDNGDQGRGGGGGSLGGRGSTSNGGGGGHDWGGREGERPGPGGSVGGGYDGWGSREGNHLGPGSGVVGEQPNYDAFNGVPAPSKEDADGFFGGAYGADPYAGPGPEAPIVLDLDGDGIEIIPLNKSKTYCDYNSDGAVGHTAWIGSGDGFLVFDADSSNTVNSAREFVFTQWSYLAARDMWALRAVFDTNRDEKLSSADTDFDKFKVWVDADGDAVTDPGELRTLKSLGLSSIPLTHNGAGKKYSDGSRIYGTATATPTKGKKITVADVGLAIGTKNASLKVTGDKIEIQPGDGTSKAVFSGEGDRAKALKLGKSGYDAAFLKQEDGTRLAAQYEISGKIKSLLHLTAAGRTISSEVWTKDQSSLMKFNKEAALTYWHMVGNSWSNVFRGGDEKSFLEGQDGNDDLYGGDARDTLDGGRGADQVYGEDGNDSLDGASGNDLLSGGDGNDDLQAGDGDDSLRGGDGKDTLSGGDGYDDLTGGDGRDMIKGGDGRDYLSGQADNDSLYGGEGLDELHGGQGNDRLDGGIGDDLLFGEDGNDRLIGDDGRDELQGGDGNDTLLGGADRDWLVGGDGQDSLYGEGGDDRLIGGDGNDRLRGEADQDTLEGGAGHDTLDGSTGDDQLRGEAGDDVLSGGDGQDDLDGGEGQDLLSGGSGNDAVLGASGNDTLHGGAGDDALAGGDGDDLLHGNEGDDLLKGNESTDVLYGEGGADYLSGGGGNDSLFGGGDDDQAYGDSGDDSLDGGEGADKLWGGAGNDTLLGGLGHDGLNGDAGHDSLNGGAGDDMLSGGIGNDTLDGGGGSDQLFGGGGNDILVGGPDVDYIDGGTGTDTIVLTGTHSDYVIRFNTALGKFSIVDTRFGSPDGTDLADIELFQFSDGVLTVAQLNYMTQVDADIAYNVESSDGSKSRIGWRSSIEDPAQIEAFIQRRNIAGTLMSETVFRPDGTRIARAWDVSANGSGEAWTSYTQTYDANAELVSQVYENDNGSFTLLSWDRGAEDWHDRETTYNSQADYEQGLASRQFETIDEGKLGVVDFIERQWDRAGATWSTTVKELDGAKRTLIENTLSDDGSGVIKGTDYAQDSRNYRDGVDAGKSSGQEWKSFEERRDAGGNKTWDSHLYYRTQQQEERTVERGWDHGGQSWTSYVLNKDHLLRSTWRQDVYDNGTNTVTQWDYTGQGWLWRKTHSSGSTKLWQRDQYDQKAYYYREWTGGSWDERETRYDSDGERYYQHLIDGDEKTIHQWDVAGQHDWSERITVTVNGKTSRIETIYGSHKMVEIFDLTGEQEWTRRVQEWRGPDFKNKVEDRYYDGSKLIKEIAWDFSGKDWDRYEKRFHDGEIAYHKTVNDNDSYTLDRLDYEGRDWDTISIKGRVIDGVERASWTETLYDDSLKIIEEKDLGNADWDTKIWKSREYGGVRLNFAEGISFDDPVTEGGRTYRFYIGFTEYPSVMNWWRVGMYAMDMDQGGDWLGWVQSDSQAGTGNSARGVLAADIVRKLKAWNGLDFVF